MSRRLFHGQLADEIAGEDRLRAERLRLLARSLVDIVRDALVRDGMVRIHGFGTFRLKRMAPRRGINPQTGEPIEIPARNRVMFRPAKALRDRIEPEHPAAVPLAEPHESREAWLGGRMGDSPVAGGLPPGDHERSHRSYFPDRVAAASMVAPTARVTASAYPEASRDSASREANLGGAMADSPSAGRVVTAYPADSDLGQSGTGAANDDSAPVEPHPESGSDQPVPPPGGTVRYESRQLPGHETVDDDGVGGGGAGRPRETGLQTLTEPPETTGTGTASSADAGLASESDRDERGSAGRWLALVALLLLAVLLAWWLWPRTESTPLATGTPGLTTEGTGDAVTRQDEPTEAGATGDTPDEPATSESATGEAADTSGERAGASSVADATGDDGEAVGTAAAQGGASPAGDEGQADTRTAQLEPEQAGADQAGSASTEPEPAASGDIESAEAQEAAVSGETGAAEAQAAASGEAGSAEPEPAASDAIGSADPEPAASGDVESAEPEPAASDEIESAAAADASAGEAAVASDGAADTQADTGAESGSDAAVAQADASSADAGGVEAAPTDTATPWFSARDYSVKAGDTLWGLSDRNYVNPYYWPHIWNHNQWLTNPDRIEIDQQLWLPRLVGEPRSLTAADRRSIAEGYLRLYRFWKDTGAANPQYALVGVRYFDASVMPPELRNDPSAGRPGDAMAAAFEALLMAEFPAQQ